jgi:tetratricopeptide (TPR) repeat protein
MGEVYLAEDTRLTRSVALKVLPTDLANDGDRMHRFQQEALAASALNHPNIVTIYDIGVSPSGPFIAMEFVKGHTLRARAESPVELDSLLHWGSQVAQALRVAHDTGIVHRDIKPENVMVRDDGYVKVLDFGVARLASANGDRMIATTRSGTNPGTLIGTVRYMSPEQARGESVTGATDMYALGTVLYELATGQHPLRAPTLLALLRAIAEQTPVAPSRLTSMPALLEHLLLSLLSKDPRTRPDAEEVERTLLEIRRHLAPGPLTSTASSSPIAAGSAVRGSVVGRERERGALQSAYAAAASSRGSLLCVVGEPGIGKTTIVEEFLATTAERERCRIARSRCSERLAGAEAYLPWLEALDALRRDRMNGLQTSQALKQTAPTWFAQLAEPSGDRPPDAAALAELKSASQERLKREFVAFVEALSNEWPLLLFFDDLHWADVSTIDLLAFLGGRLAAMRVLIVATYRPSDMQLANHPFLRIKNDLQIRGVCRELEMEFLSQQEVSSYLALEFPDHSFPQEFVALIYTKTEGSPLFMADLVRDLRDRRVLALEEGRWRLTQDLPLIERDLPESVRAMIERKIAQLSQDDRRLLAAASVLGYQFDSTVIAKSLGADEADIEDRLATLERVYSFVRLAGEEELPDRSVSQRYRFVHVLYQSALYATLSPSRRAALSRDLAAALLTCYGSQRARVAVDLANLFETARDFEHAADHFLQAARNATRVFANHEAIALARRGLAALRNQPETPARARRELELQLTLGWPLINTIGYSAAEVEATFARARELCGGDSSSPQLGEVIWGLAMCYLLRAQYSRTRGLATEMLRTAQSIDNPALQVTAHYTLGTVLVYLGELLTARNHFERAIALCDASAGERLTMPDGRDPGVSSRAQLARVLWLLGYPDQAVTISAAAQEAAGQHAQPLGQAFALYLDMLLRQFRGEVAQAKAAAESLMTTAREHRLAQYAAWAEIVQGWSCTLQGERDGVDRIRRGLDKQDEMGSVLSRPHFLALLAEARERTGQIDEGLAAVSEGLASVERFEERYYEAELNRLQGLLLENIAGKRNEALACFERAAQIAARQSARSLELRSVIDLARAWSREGRGADAHARLASAYGWFTEGFDTADLIEARTLLAELATADPGRPSD